MLYQYRIRYILVFEKNPQKETRSLWPLQEYFFSYQATFGLYEDYGFPGITLGKRHYKTGLKEWNSYNYIDAQIAFVTIGTGVGVIYDNSNIFYKYKLFAGWFGLATCDYITFKDKPKIHLGAFGVFPIFEYVN